jgi:hypothetical protein
MPGGGDRSKAAGPIVGVLLYHPPRSRRSSGAQRHQAKMVAMGDKAGVCSAAARSPRTFCLMFKVAAHYMETHPSHGPLYDDVARQKPARSGHSE